MNTYIRNLKNTMIAAAVLALMTAITGNACAEAKNSLHYLAVGVSTVPQMPANMQLRYAHKDALDLAQTWKTQGGSIYGSVKGETLINENAKLADILAALDRLDTNAKTGDTAVVSFAGHGGVMGQRTAQWLFVPYDHNPHKPMESSLQEWQLRNQLARLTQRGVTVILILDTCHSGAFGTADSGIVILAACSAHENAGELSQLQNGLFSRAIIEAIQGRGDANNDGMVTLDEVEAYVAARVAELDRLHPVFDPNGQRQYQQPVTRRPAGVQRDLPLGSGNGSTPTPQPSNLSGRIQNNGR